MSYLQVPDLDLRVHGSCSKNEPIRVELRTGESYEEGEEDTWSVQAGEDREQVRRLFSTFLTCPAQKSLALGRGQWAVLSLEEQMSK